MCCLTPPLICTTGTIKANMGNHNTKNMAFCKKKGFITQLVQWIRRKTKRENPQRLEAIIGSDKRYTGASQWCVCVCASLFDYLSSCARRRHWSKQSWSPATQVDDQIVNGCAQHDEMKYAAAFTGKIIDKSQMTRPWWLNEPECTTRALGRPSATELIRRAWFSPPSKRPHVSGSCLIRGSCYEVFNLEKQDINSGKAGNAPDQILSIAMKAGENNAAYAPGIWRGCPTKLMLLLQL